MPDTPADGFRNRPAWLLAVAGLVVAQAGLALALFGPARSRAAVTDDRPILSGRHPLHLYHGTLGASSFRARGTTTCFDPRFQAGYPKTPVFDGGSRPAELFLVLGGGTYRPGAYKLGLFVFLACVPAAFALAARGAGLPAGAAVLAGIGGMLLGWSGPVRRMITEGQFDMLAAGLAAVVFVPWLARFARSLGVDSWVVLAASALVGWFSHPVVWVGLVPVVFAYYLVFAPRLGPAWHLGLLGVAFAGITPNAWWVVDWARYWWVRNPAGGDFAAPPDWAAVAGTPADYPALFACLPAWPAVAAGGLIGAVLLWRAGHRTAAWLLVLSAGLAVAAARVASAWGGLSEDVPDRVVVLAAGFLVAPAAYASWAALRRVRLAAVGTSAAVCALMVVGWADGPGRPLARALGIAADPLVVGLTAGQRDLVAVIKQHTTPDARILWDETADQRPGWNWSALLPVLTDRAYLGGLDPDAGVEHSYCAMCGLRLSGRDLADWSDADLEAFCRWYNVGWVVARSPGAVERWGRFPKARAVATLAEGGRPVVFYALDRPRSFVLAGAATWESADARRIVLTDVVPNADGEVQLSLHWIEPLRVFPGYVFVEPMPDPTGRDPVHHIRLRVPGRTPRVTLTWEAP